MTTDEIDFEEAARNCDKEIFMMYYDEAQIGRNFILKLRKLLNNKKLTLEEFKEEVTHLNTKLKIRHQRFLQKHLLQHHLNPPSQDAQ